jgi:sugar phosphate isomerase/epimerase
MRLSVVIASTPEWKPEEAVKILASQGWHGIEWTGLEDNLDTIHTITCEAGLEISAIGDSVPPTRRADVDRMLAATAALGAERVRIAGLGVEEGQTYREAFAACQEDWGWIEERARHYGVRALVELRPKTLTPSASAARRLLEGLDPQYVGVSYDIGSLVIEGWEEPEHGLDLLAEYLAHVQVKNCAFHLAGVESDGTLRWEPKWVPLREGRARLPELFKALAVVGYDGWVAVEDLSTAVSVPERTAANLEYLTALAGAAGYDLG